MLSIQRTRVSASTTAKMGFVSKHKKEIFPVVVPGSGGGWMSFFIVVVVVGFPSAEGLDSESACIFGDRKEWVKMGCESKDSFVCTVSKLSSFPLILGFSIDDSVHRWRDRYIY